MTHQEEEHRGLIERKALHACQQSKNNEYHFLPSALALPATPELGCAGLMQCS